jgi:RimJ/RimL family protein N-acetyltransferase
VRSRSISLRAVEPGDLPLLYVQQLDPLANAMAVSRPRTETAFAAHWEKILSNPEIVARAIIADVELAGQISVFQMDGLNAVGYWIARERWGGGVATGALTLLLEEVPTRPLHARAARSNAASIRVLQRCGFVLTGHRMSPGDERFPACEEAEFVLF